MPKPIFQFMDTVGDGSGSYQATGNYSSAVTNFKFTDLNGAGFSGRAEIHRLLVKVQDVGALDADKYGNGITLTNGIVLTLRDSSDAVVYTYTAAPVKSSGDWAGLCYDVQNLAFGTGDEILAVRWTFSRAGAPIKIDCDEGYYLNLALNDDLSGLTAHTFQLQGQYYD